MVNMGPGVSVARAREDDFVTTRPPVEVVRHARKERSRRKIAVSHRSDLKECGLALQRDHKSYGVWSVSEHVLS